MAAILVACKDNGPPPLANLDRTRTQAASDV